MRLFLSSSPGRADDVGSGSHLPSTFLSWSTFTVMEGMLKKAPMPPVVAPIREVTPRRTSGRKLILNSRPVDVCAWKGRAENFVRSLV